MDEIITYLGLKEVQKEAFIRADLISYKGELLR